MRWQSGSITPRSLGENGRKLPRATPLTGAVRKIFVYRDNSDQRHTLVGTDSNLYEDNGSTYTDITPSAFVPLNTIGTGGGYGTLTYGSSTYGTPRSGSSPIFSPFAYWTMDSWGEDGIPRPIATGAYSIMRRQRPLLLLPSSPQRQRGTTELSSRRRGTW